jgi:NAD(P)H-nitrite reductase large subunit
MDHMQRLLVIGNGMSAVRLVARLVERRARFEITIVGDGKDSTHCRTGT